MTPMISKDRGYRFFSFFDKKLECMCMFIRAMERLDFGWNQRLSWQKTIGCHEFNSGKSKLLLRNITMNSKAAGNVTSQTEITHISSHGVWLLTGDKELFMSYADFPWFKDAPIGKVLNITEPTLGHFYWPDLDVDLGIESIEYPERFPLVGK